MIQVSAAETPPFSPGTTSPEERRTQKRTKAAYQYLQGKKGIKKIELDEVSIVNTINDESQTVYGEHKNENNEINDLGASAMGLDKYKNLIKENGNPSQVVVATIGYGAAIHNGKVIGAPNISVGVSAGYGLFRF